jgi:hypothetical protein
MQRMTATIGVLIVLGAATGTHGQSQQHRRIVGKTIGEHWQVNGSANSTRTTTATSTLTFSGNDDGPVLTVDFTTRFPGTGRPTSPPSVVDIIVTEHPASDDAPEMTMRVNGDSLLLATRLHSSRSIAATIPFDEFVRMTNAETIVEQAFDTELVFSSGQLGMLRSIAQRWTGR